MKQIENFEANRSLIRLFLWQIIQVNTIHETK